MLLLLLASLVVSDEPTPPPAPTPLPSALPSALPSEPPPAPSDAALTVAVLDLKASAGNEGAARALTTLLTNEIGARQGFRAISRNEVKALLAHQADQRLVGCEEAQCAADIGKLLSAQRVIAGSIEGAADAGNTGGVGEGAVGGAVVFSLTMVDPEGPTVLERVAYTWRTDVDELVDLARPAVDRLVFGKQAESFVGSVEILASQAGAQVVIDDRELGVTPLSGPVRDLTIGAHRVELRKAGFVPWGKDVAVTQGETQIVQADLIDETSLQPWYARWYVWGSALAGVVIIGGTAAAIGTYSYLSTPTKIIVGRPQ